jgi:hypothetical protein
MVGGLLELAPLEPGVGVDGRARLVAGPGDSETRFLVLALGLGMVDDR